MVLLRHDYCGSIESASANYGRTLTHEAGHWLNLRHIWGDDDCGDDNIDDTPTGKEPNYGVCDSNGDAAGEIFLTPLLLVHALLVLDKSLLNLLEKCL